ncbi:MAG: hypothetical protein F8N15_01425 [Methanobacterium sp.]|nr:hypothetical protein [Methanobacterium sp.]
MRIDTDANAGRRLIEGGVHTVEVAPYDGPLTTDFIDSLPGEPDEMMAYLVGLLVAGKKNGASHHA